MPTQLVQRPGIPSRPSSCLLDRQHLDQPRSLRTGSAPNVCPFFNAPSRYEEMHLGVHKICQRQRDATDEYRSREYILVMWAIDQCPPMGEHKKFACICFGQGCHYRVAEGAALQNDPVPRATYVRTKSGTNSFPASRTCHTGACHNRRVIRGSSSLSLLTVSSQHTTLYVNLAVFSAPSQSPTHLLRYGRGTVPLLGQNISG